MAAVEMLPHVTRPPTTILDVGVGIAKAGDEEHLVFRKAFPGAKMIGLEPCMPRFQKLVGGFDGLLLPYAAWNENTRLETFRREEASEFRDSASCFRNFNPGHAVSEWVEARTLDWIDRHVGFMTDVLLWMDIEGAELNALKGGEELLERVHWINLEVRPKPKLGASEAELVAHLYQRGFALVAKHNQHGGHCDAIFVRTGKKSKTFL